VIVQTENVWKTFGSFGALKGLSLCVPEGSHFALLGANGAGKTTSIKMLMNIVQPTRGIATILGVDSRRLSRRELVRIGYVSESQELPGRMTVGGYISYLRPFYPDWDRTLEAEVLRSLRLPLERRIKNLSHGMRLKMALACALPFRPKLLVMDEPLSGLDPLMREEVMQSLFHWTSGATVLMSSHELVEVEEFATHVAFLDRGKLLFQEATHDLVKRFREVRAIFAHPVGMAAGAPPQWLELRSDGHALSFIDTHYSDEETLASALTGIVGSLGQLECRPMGLRSIFTALARTMQTEEP